MRNTEKKHQIHRILAGGTILALVCLLTLALAPARAGAYDPHWLHLDEDDGDGDAEHGEELRPTESLRLAALVQESETLAQPLGDGRTTLADVVHAAAHGRSVLIGLHIGDAHGQELFPAVAGATGVGVVGGQDAPLSVVVRLVNPAGES